MSCDSGYSLNFHLRGILGTTRALRFLKGSGGLLAAFWKVWGFLLGGVIINFGISGNPWHPAQPKPEINHKNNPNSHLHTPIFKMKSTSFLIWTSLPHAEFPPIRLPWVEFPPTRPPPPSWFSTQVEFSPPSPRLNFSPPQVEFPPLIPQVESPPPPWVGFDSLPFPRVPPAGWFSLDLGWYFGFLFALPSRRGLVWPSRVGSKHL